MLYDSKIRGWSNHAVKDWAFACLLNSLFPLMILCSVTLSRQFGGSIRWMWVGAMTGGALIFALGIYFAGRENIVFARIIDGAYILALYQLIPYPQFMSLAASGLLWLLSSEIFGIRSGELPFLEAYFVTIGYGLFSLFPSIYFGASYRKPRWYPQYLRPWNNTWDQTMDTFTKRSQ